MDDVASSFNGMLGYGSGSIATAMISPRSWELLEHFPTAAHPSPPSESPVDELQVFAVTDRQPSGRVSWRIVRGWFRPVLGHRGGAGAAGAVSRPDPRSRVSQPRDTTARSAAETWDPFVTSSVGIDDPYIDRGSRHFAWMKLALGSFQAIDPIVGCLSRTSPRPCAEHTFHRQRGLDQVIGIPDLVGATSWS